MMSILSVSKQFGYLTRVVVVLLFCFHGALGGDQLEQRSENVYGEIATRQFAGRKDVRQVIDPPHFNARLLSAAIFHRTNIVRSQHNLSPLKYNAMVANAAQKHAETMAGRDSLFHGSPRKENGRTPYERLRNEGLQPHFSAENIAFKFLLHLESGRPVFVREENGETIYSYEPGGRPLKPRTYASFARAIVQQWMDSPLHRENVLSKEATELGVGCALSRGQNSPPKIFCDQDFFAPFQPPAP